ncbi:MAG: hypothetical protein HYX35_03905 [Proteobacteria bacterium]|nr:hypothetical protein [Pseudomonadota bacterium]
MSREVSASEPPLFLKDISEKNLWDKRFLIDPEIKMYFPEESYLGPLRSAMPPSLMVTEVPRRIWPALPAIWVKEEVVAIPHLCYTLLKSETDLEKFIYLKPPFHDSLRFTI